MRRTCRFAVLVVVLVVPLRASQAAQLMLGKAVVDITPVPGTPMLTPQSRPFVKLAEPAHDPLCVRAVVIELAGVKVAIAACDLTSIPNAMFDEARQRIVTATGISADAIMLSATHTHTAPQIRARFLGKVDDAARKKCLDYIDSLPGRIAEAVIAAHATLQQCRVSAAIGREDTISFNRRFVMKNGSVMTNPGKDDPTLHQQIARPAGPTDPEIGVVYFDSPDGHALATLVNFSLHLDT
ncbi:MAG TPA: hypothetical protein VM165_00365, partial [Planctomycetaceae bacterium]|nr:hypothetical protein [Planctomycetaceae bacterium]